MEEEKDAASTKEEEKETPEIQVIHVYKTFFPFLAYVADVAVTANSVAVHATRNGWGLYMREKGDTPK